MRRAHALLLALLLAPLTAACGTDADGRFDAQSATPSPACIRHQTREPGRSYTAGQQSDPHAVLEMMRFYTANGTKPYCDGAAPTAADRRWTGLYVELGGNSHNLSKTQR
jgi:hypothetical protein